MAYISTSYADAWAKWISSRDAVGCTTGKADGVFLLNRLHRAFKAGWMAHEKEMAEAAQKEKLKNE